MRSLVGAFALILAVAPGAYAEEINLLSPPMIANAGLKEINTRYTGTTGVTFEIAGAEITVAPWRSSAAANSSRFRSAVIPTV